ncbi:MerR family transcriptional regulator [Kribbella sp. NPDC004875]|uniref:MerR family transcriptional regulator n=1 Tax=Kribbella sp. NPDC004875 TaxID=3364107 RepID=UPI003690D846
MSSIQEGRCTDGFTPAAAAEKSGLSLDALRYYEREGLVGPIARNSAGHRRYSEGDLAWVGVVTCLRDAGLGINDLREFTGLLRRTGDFTDKVAFLADRRVDLLERVATIQAAVKVLDEKIQYFSEQRSPGSE